MFFDLIKLGLRRNQSDEDYQNLQNFIAQATIKELTQRGVNLSQSKVLELGSGKGGYSIALNTHSLSFTASDCKKNPFFDQNDIPFTVVDVLKPFPFETNTFDFIYCSSVIEHLTKPMNMLLEAKRVLKPAGRILISFPPFYSLALVGGHQFKPFHFLGEKLAISCYNRIFKTNIKNYETCYGYCGLHPLTIKQVKELIQNSGLKIQNIYTRMSPINTAQWPGFLKDLFTWHVCYLAHN